jgi:hypothetical protein
MYSSIIYCPSECSRPLPRPFVQCRSSSFASFIDIATAAGRRVAYSEEGDSNNDAPVLGARKLVDGVADVAVVLGGAAGATNTSGSFRGHVVCCVCGLWFW